MSKSAKPLPLRRSDDGKWEIKNDSGTWIECETKKDAEILSNSPIVLDEFYKISLPNEEMAAKLERTAEKQEQYKMLSTARFFRNRAKLAKGNKIIRKRQQDKRTNRRSMSVGLSIGHYMLVLLAIYRIEHFLIVFCAFYALEIPPIIIHGSLNFLQG